jgi:hypothetical protein
MSVVLPNRISAKAGSLPASRRPRDVVHRTVERLSALWKQIYPALLVMVLLSAFLTAIIAIRVLVWLPPYRH